MKEFVTRNVGREAFEKLVEPFCTGVYAGDASKLSMKAAFPRASSCGGAGARPSSCLAVCVVGPVSLWDGPFLGFPAQSDPSARVRVRWGG